MVELDPIEEPWYPAEGALADIGITTNFNTIDPSSVTMATVADAFAQVYNQPLLPDTMLMSPSTYQHYVYLMSQEDPEAVVTPTFETKQIYKVEVLATIIQPPDITLQAGDGVMINGKYVTINSVVSNSDSQKVTITYLLPVPTSYINITVDITEEEPIREEYRPNPLIGREW
jgi:hypothetical protein